MELIDPYYDDSKTHKKATEPNTDPKYWEEVLCDPEGKDSMAEPSQTLRAGSPYPYQE